MRFNRAVDLADRVISAVQPRQLGDPTPCTAWSVRQLISHVVVGMLQTLGMVTAGRRPDRNQDHLGDDPLAAFRDAVRQLRDALARPGLVDRTDPESPGPGPAIWMVNMLVVELTVHSWDIAKATGQRTDIDPGLADWVLRTLRQGLSPDRRDGGYAPEQRAPVYLGIAERMAAFAGRRVE